jgi:hypothetical protein
MASTLMRALAGVLFAARVRTAFQADALTIALPGAGSARQRRGSLAHGFGDKFVAHVKILGWLRRREKFLL